MIMSIDCDWVTELEGLSRRSPPTPGYNVRTLVDRTSQRPSSAWACLMRCSEYLS